MSVTKYKRPIWAVEQKILPNGKVMDVNQYGEMFPNEEWLIARAILHPEFTLDITKNPPETLKPLSKEEMKKTKKKLEAARKEADFSSQITGHKD